MSNINTQNQKRAVVAYHFFAHYRRGVVSRLLSDNHFHYSFIADVENPLPDGIKPMDAEELQQSGRFTAAKCYRWKQILWQPSLTWKLMQTNSEAWILLGYPHNVSVWTAAIIGRIFGKRVLFWTHGWLRTESKRKAFIRNTFNRLAHGFLLYGHGAKRIAVASGFDPCSMYVVYNSLDYEKQVLLRNGYDPHERKRIRKELFTDPFRPVLICTTRLTAVRNLPLALQAMAKLKAQGVETSLLLVGDGPERGKLEQIAKELELSVYFYGACYDESVIASLIMAADVTISPGKVGLTAMHSLAYGVPVVTHNDAENQMPEWEAVIEGWSGCLFERGNIDDAANAILRALELSKKGEAVRLQCFEVIDEFYNPERQAQVLAQALSGSPAEHREWDELNRRARLGEWCV